MAYEIVCSMYVFFAGVERGDGSRAGRCPACWLLPPRPATAGNHAHGKSGGFLRSCGGHVGCSWTTTSPYLHLHTPWSYIRGKSRCTACLVCTGSLAHALVVWAAGRGAPQVRVCGDGRGVAQCDPRVWHDVTCRSPISWVAFARSVCSDVSGVGWTGWNAVNGVGWTTTGSRAQSGERPAPRLPQGLYGPE